MYSVFIILPLFLPVSLDHSHECALESFGTIVHMLYAWKSKEANKQIDLLRAISLLFSFFSFAAIHYHSEESKACLEFFFVELIADESPFRHADVRYFDLKFGYFWGFLFVFVLGGRGGGGGGGEVLRHLKKWVNPI